MILEIIFTLASIATLLAYHFWYIGDARELSNMTANIGMTLLWIVLFIKPLLILSGKYATMKSTKKAERISFIKTFSSQPIHRCKNLIINVVRTISALGMKYRRTLGILTFLFIFTHGGISIIQRLQKGYSISNQLQSFWILAWYIGVFCLLVGYLTSNNRSIRFFKKYRKRIQRIAYLALVAGVFHLISLNPWEYFWQGIVLIIYAIFKLWERNIFSKHQ